MNRSGLQLVQEILACSSQSVDLARVRHRTGVVEHQCNAQSRIAPGRHRRCIDVDQADANKAEKLRVVNSGATQRQL